MKLGIYKIDTSYISGTFVEEVELVQLALSISPTVELEKFDFDFTGKNVKLCTTDREVVVDFSDYDLSCGFNPFAHYVSWEDRFENIKGLDEEDFEDLTLKDLMIKFRDANSNS